MQIQIQIQIWSSNIQLSTWQFKIQICRFSATLSIHIYIYHNWNQEFMHHFGNLTDSVVVHSHRFIYVYIFGRCYALLSIFGGAMNQLIIKGLWHRVQRRPPCRRFDNVPRERNIVLPLHTTVCHSSFPLYWNSRWSYRGQIIPGG